jgi:hypothetical protein
LPKPGHARDTRIVKRALVAVAIAALALHGGGGCEGEGGDAAKRDAPVATVFGHVRLAPGEPLPLYPEVMLGREPLHPREAPGPLPPECADAGTASRAPVTMDAARGLAGMVVTASDFHRYRPAKPAARRVRIEGCALRPRTIAMTQGDRLVIENLDAFAFAPLFGPAYEAKPLPRGQRVFLRTYPGTIEPLSCSSDAPCGRADVYVLRHPVHAVSGANGAYRIENVPAGELVRLTALHPLFEDVDAQVWLDPGQKLRVDLVVRPKPRFVPAPP